MAESQETVRGLADAKTAPAGGFQARGVLQVSMDVLADSDTGKLHLLSRDAINGLQVNTQSDEAEMFSACFAVLLTALPLLGSLLGGIYFGSVVIGRLINVLLLALFSLVIVSGLGTYYFFKKRKTAKDQREAKFKKILEDCKTVMVLNQPD